MSFHVHQVPGAGAEDVVVAPDGSVFTGTEDGAILRLSPDGRRVDRVADTGGRPLGLELFDNGDLLVCDPDAGLLVVHVADGSIETLVTDIDGVRIAVLQQRRDRRRRHHLVQRLVAALRRPRVEGRLRPAHAAPAGWCDATSTAPSPW